MTIAPHPNTLLRGKPLRKDPDEKLWKQHPR